MPVADDSMTGDQPTYRDLWLRIRDDLPKKGRKTDAVGGEPKLPAELRGRAAQPVRQLREVVSSAGSRTPTRRRAGLTPPVFIVVCNNTNVSKLVFDYIAGWDEAARPTARRSSCPAQLPLFRNDDGDGGWSARPEHDPGRQPSSSNPARR